MFLKSYTPYLYFICCFVLSLSFAVTNRYKFLDQKGVRIADHIADLEKRTDRIAEWGNNTDLIAALQEKVARAENLLLSFIKGPEDVKVKKPVKGILNRRVTLSCLLYFSYFLEFRYFEDKLPSVLENKYVHFLFINIPKH